MLEIVTAIKYMHYTRLLSPSQLLRISATVWHTAVTVERAEFVPEMVARHGLQWKHSRRNLNVFKDEFFPQKKLRTFDWHVKYEMEEIYVSLRKF